MAVARRELVQQIILYRSAKRYERLLDVSGFTKEVPISGRRSVAAICPQSSLRYPTP
jgi:hypothetical protein